MTATPGSRLADAWHWATAALAVVTLGLLSVIVGLLAHPPDPWLSVTACTPPSYLAPDPVGDDAAHPGPTQGQCSPVVPGALTVDELADGIPVAGQVCNLTDAPIAADVTVSWVAVDGSARIPVLDVPVVYPPGCRRPYTVRWIPPLGVLEAIAVQHAAGYPIDDPALRWRIVGEAVRVDDPTAVYRWDSVRQFAVIPGGPTP